MELFFEFFFEFVMDAILYKRDSYIFPPSRIKGSIPCIVSHKFTKISNLRMSLIHRRRTSGASAFWNMLEVP